MIRKIIKINEEKCNGCGACAKACHEGAIEMINGKAKLTRENYCDGLGDCLPACPTDAISFEEREAPAYDEAAVLAAKASKAHSSNQSQIANEKNNSYVTTSAPLPCGCPGMDAKAIEGQLSQWPVQIKLVPVSAPYFENKDLLIAADCTAYAYGNFHNEFIKNRITLIGCPKLDAVDYTEKLTAIIAENNIKSVTVTRMVVPCCGGIEYAAKQAIAASGKNIPLNIVTISTDGKILA